MEFRSRLHQMERDFQKQRSETDSWLATERRLLEQENMKARLGAEAERRRKFTEAEHGLRDKKLEIQKEYDQKKRGR
jgi:hypothetical protein